MPMMMMMRRRKKKASIPNTEPPTGGQSKN